MKSEAAPKKANIRFLVPLLFSFMVVSCLIAGLWPFEFAPQNGARLDGSGLKFTSRGIAYACGKRPLFPSGGFTAWLLVEPVESSLDGAGEIISFYDGGGLLLGVFQWKDRVIVRSGKKEYETGAKSVLPRDRKTLITVSAGKRGIWIYADGKRAGGTARPFHGLEKAACFTLGNSPDGRMPWNGSLFGLLISGKELSPGEVPTGRETALSGPDGIRPALVASYLFEGSGAPVRNMVSEELSISVPEKFRVVKRVLLQPLFDSSRVRIGAADAIINFLGFIPVGFLCFFLPSGRGGLVKAAAAVSAGFLLSLGIEVTQVFIPVRYSQLSDLLLNTGGAAFGAAAAFFSRVAAARLRLID